MMRVSAQKLFCGPGEAAFQSFATAVFALPFEPGQLPYDALAALFEPMASGPPERPLLLPDELLRPAKGRCGALASAALGWILHFQDGAPRKQRYHSHVSAENVPNHCAKVWADGLWISAVATCEDGGKGTAQYTFVADSAPRWGVDMALRPAEQRVHLSRNSGSSNGLPTAWIATQWNMGYIITAVAGQASGDSLVVMTRIPGAHSYEQRYRLHDGYPFEWMVAKRAAGFSVTSMAAFGGCFLVVVSRLPGSASSSTQALEMDFCYPSEPIHQLWNTGMRLRLIAANKDCCSAVLEAGNLSENVERKPGTTFPSAVVKKHWEKNSYLVSMTYGRVLA
jgi:hypothetical protein